MNSLSNFLAKHSEEVRLASSTTENGTFSVLKEFCSPKIHHAAIAKERGISFNKGLSAAFDSG